MHSGCAMNPRSLSGAPDVTGVAELLGEPADGLVGVAVARPCARRCACRRGGRSCGCGRRRPGRSPAASGRSARARGTWRPGAARRPGGAARGEQLARSRCRTPRRCAAWMSSTVRGARGCELGIEAGEDLVGELGGDRAAGERAEGDDADQGALERADVVARRARRSSSSAPASTPRSRPAATRLRRIVSRVAASGGRTSVDEAGLEALAQAVLERVEVARQAVGGQHELRAGARAAR